MASRGSSSGFRPTGWAARRCLLTAAYRGPLPALSEHAGALGEPAAVLTLGYAHGGNGADAGTHFVVPERMLPAALMGHASEPVVPLLLSASPSPLSGEPFDLFLFVDVARLEEMQEAAAKGSRPGVRQAEPVNRLTPLLPPEALRTAVLHAAVREPLSRGVDRLRAGSADYVASGGSLPALADALSASIALALRTAPDLLQQLDGDHFLRMVHEGHEGRTPARRTGDPAHDAPGARARSSRLNEEELASLAGTLKAATRRRPRHAGAPLRLLDPRPVQQGGLGRWDQLDLPALLRATENALDAWEVHVAQGHFARAPARTPDPSRRPPPPRRYGSPSPDPSVPPPRRPGPYGSPPDPPLPPRRRPSPYGSPPPGGAGRPPYGSA